MLQPHPSSEDIVIVQENEYCQSERMTIFIGIIYAYKGLLLVSIQIDIHTESNAYIRVLFHSGIRKE